MNDANKMFARQKSSLTQGGGTMTNKEKFEGKTVEIFAPFGGRSLGYLIVSKVLKENVICGTIVGTDIETAYYLSDGISVEVMSNPIM